MKYKIYKLVYNDVVVYVGRTKQTLKRRKQTGYRSNAAVQAIYKECEIEFIEETNDKSRESYWIEKYEDTLLNILTPRKMTKKEYDNQRYQANKEHILEQKKEWYEANKEHRKEKIREQAKEYYQANKEKKKEYQREYHRKKKN